MISYNSKLNLKFAIICELTKITRAIPRSWAIPSGTPLAAPPSLSTSRSPPRGSLMMERSETEKVKLRLNTSLGVVARGVETYPFFYEMCDMTDNAFVVANRTHFFKVRLICFGSLILLLFVNHGTIIKGEKEICHLYFQLTPNQTQLYDRSRR